MILVRCHLENVRDKWKCDMTLGECFRTVEEDVVMVSGVEINVNHIPIEFHRKGIRFTNFTRFEEYNIYDISERCNLEKVIKKVMTETEERLMEALEGARSNEELQKLISDKIIKIINSLDGKGFYDRIKGKVNLQVINR